MALPQLTRKNLGVLLGMKFSYFSSVSASPSRLSVLKLLAVCGGMISFANSSTAQDAGGVQQVQANQDAGSSVSILAQQQQQELATQFSNLHSDHLPSLRCTDSLSVSASVIETTQIAALRDETAHGGTGAMPYATALLAQSVQFGCLLKNILNNQNVNSNTPNIEWNRLSDIGRFIGESTLRLGHASFRYARALSMPVETGFEMPLLQWLAFVRPAAQNLETLYATPTDAHVLAPVIRTMRTFIESRAGTITSEDRTRARTTRGWARLPVEDLDRRIENGRLSDFAQRLVRDSTEQGGPEVRQFRDGFCPLLRAWDTEFQSYVGRIPPSEQLLANSPVRAFSITHEFPRLMLDCNGPGQLTGTLANPPARLPLGEFLPIGSH